MRRQLRWVSILGALSMMASSQTFGRSDNAPGGPDGKGPCVRECTQLNKGCVQTAHQLKTSCRAGCSEVRLDFINACDPNGDGIFDLNPNDDSVDPDTGELIDPCAQAQDALDTCLMPCKRTFKGAASRCVLRLRQCFLQQCGIVPPPADGGDPSN